MANLCCTDITFYSKNENQIKEFYNELDKIVYKNKPVMLKYNSNDLANVILSFGLEEKNLNDYRCRGSINFISELNIEDDIYDFCLSQDDAWTAQVDIWDYILLNYPDVKWVYMAEEIAYNYYINTDKEKKYYRLQYVLKINFEDTIKDGIMYYEDYENMADDIANYTGMYPKHFEDIKIINDRIKEIDKENYIEIYKYDTD